LIVISDASPLIALFDCDEIQLLETAFDEVIIPQEVEQEVFRRGQLRVKPRFIKIHTLEGAALGDFVRLRQVLDLGESAAVALAIEKQLPVMIDEEAGRGICEREGVQFISLAEVIARLRRDGSLSEKRYVKVRSALMRVGVYCP
jgi:predicted nucleic acid-binding protein